MTAPSRRIPITDLAVGEFMTTYDSALKVVAVTPSESGGVRVDFENAATVWFPGNAEVLVRDVSVR